MFKLSTSHVRGNGNCCKVMLVDYFGSSRPKYYLRHEVDFNPIRPASKALASQWHTFSG